MAKGVKFGGKVDYDYWIKQVNKTKTTGEAASLLRDILNSATAGIFNVGVSDKDQATIMKLINKLGERHQVDVSGIATKWDPSKNSINSAEHNKARDFAIDQWNRAVDKKKAAGEKTNSNQNNNSNNTSSGSGSGSGTSSGSGSKPSYSSGGSSSSSNSYNKAINKITEYVDSLKNPKVWTAKELAELYGVEDQYNYEKILKDYNDATTKYYDDAVDKQLEYNDDANTMNTTYANKLINKYLDSYATQAPTAVGQGVLAANALANSLSTDFASGATATSLNNIINMYEEQRKAELESNKVNARTDYNAIGQYLANQGALKHAADVKQYIGNLNAATTAYAGARNAQAQYASGLAAQYQANAQAALYGAASNNANTLKTMYDYYFGNYSPNGYQYYLDSINKNEKAE